MNRFSTRRLTSLLLYGFMIASPAAFAVTATANASLGLEYTDNARLTATNEVEDQIVTAQVGGTLTKTGGASSANAIFSLSRKEYLDNTFGTRDYMQLGSAFNWEPVTSRLSLSVQDYYNQTAVDNLAPNLPDNSQNTNAFSLSANTSFPLANRHSLSIRPTFNDFRYSKSDIDNQQLGLSAGWLYQFKPTMRFSLNSGFSHVDYKSDTVPDYDSRNLNLAMSGTTARMQYSASIGKTRVDRAALANNTGTSASVSVKYEVSSRSTLQAHLSQNITNTSALFLGYAIDPATGNITNVQSSGGAVHNRSMRVSYVRKGTSVTADAWAELRKLEYSSAIPDRNTQEIGAQLRYSVSSAMTASLNSSFIRNDQSTGSNIQHQLILGAGLGYSISRRMGASFGVVHQSRDDTQATNEYDEFRVSASLGYRLWP